jgi:hypothetical protein
MSYFELRWTKAIHRVLSCHRRGDNSNGESEEKGGDLEPELHWWAVCSVLKNRRTRCSFYPAHILSRTKIENKIK